MSAYISIEHQRMRFCPTHTLLFASGASSCFALHRCPRGTDRPIYPAFERSPTGTSLREQGGLFHCSVFTPNNSYGQHMVSSSHMSIFKPHPNLMAPSTVSCIISLHARADLCECKACLSWIMGYDHWHLLISNMSSLGTFQMLCERRFASCTDS